MKNTIIAFVLIITAVAARAQRPDTIARPDTGKNKIIRICVPSKHSLLPPPLYVITSHKSKFAIADTAIIRVINPNDIQSIDVLKNSTETKSYGEAGKNGVLLIKMKDSADDAFKKLKQLLKQGKVTELN